ncbi:MAG: DUF4954 family protein [Spirochaetes bacterium]|nr:DUF4954 family protein [Spirochaetota bacterium]
MSETNNKSMEYFSKNFINPEYLKKNDDPYFYRNKKNGKVQCRHLHANEVEILVKNNNFAEDWNEILVTDEFDPTLVKNCEFYGRITIGKLTNVYLEKNELRLPVGITNSTIISCDIGDNVIIRHVHYLSHYIINNNCILFNIEEMFTTDNAKFGNGILKEGESEDIRIWLEVSNENCERKILPFESIITADAYIWSKYRDDEKLMKKFIEITESGYDKKCGYYGVIGTESVIKNCRIIRNVKVGEYAYIKGANKLKNLTINSSKEEPTQIGEGVELVNGIVGYSSKIFYGCKAVRFVTGRNTQVKYGARLINSMLGDNSTVSCCEILNNLVFPFHEQHHNNSFLIAATVLGQSNIAAGATIGSNHNSRSPDGELFAGRGFWPGLCTNFKYNSKFASFVLTAKGTYHYELNILYPFSLISTDLSGSPIKIIPAYWFVYNMYAIARNNYKFKARDKRVNKVQNIEFDYLAPDTVSEMLSSIKRIQYLIGKKINTEKKTLTDIELISKGKEYFNNNKEEPEIIDDEAMNKYGAIILKPLKSIHEYTKMCKYFALKYLITYFNFIEQDINFNIFMEKINQLYAKKLYTSWINLGGQLVPEEEVETLIDNIKNGKLSSWDMVHNHYKILWEKYPEQKARYALYVLEEISETKIFDISTNLWKSLLNDVIAITKDVLALSISTRQKDFESPFRKMSYRNKKEMEAVLGNVMDNSFIKGLEKETSVQVAVYQKISESIK